MADILSRNMIADMKLKRGGDLSMALRQREGIGKINSGVVTDKDEFRAACPAFCREKSCAQD
jgi:hypothetical protein